MSEIADNHRKRYVDHTMDISKKLVSSIAPDIHQMNARSWATLVISILKAGLPSTAGMIPRLERYLTERKITIILIKYPYSLLPSWKIASKPI